MHQIRWSMNRPFAIRRSARGGLSLLELLVVIGILSVVAMVSWPMLQRPLNRSVIQDAGRQLQRALSAARFYAMESGKPVYFQYQAHSGRYWLGEKPATPDTTIGDTEKLALGEKPDSATIHSLPTGSNSDAANARVPNLPEIWGVSELPDLVVFAAGPVDETRSESEISRTDPDQEEEPATESMVESAEWSYPVTFYPGGRIIPARIHLSSADGYKLEIEIQGLAGRIKVFPTHR